MEMNMGKFSEKLVGLLELAKKKKNVLEYQEISDYFKDQPLDAEQMDKIFDFLEASGVDVLRITDNGADDLICHVFSRFTGKQRKTTKTKRKLQPKQQK